MSPLKITAIRLCGLGTLMLIGVCAADFAAGIDLHLTVQMSLLFAAAAFVVANVQPAAATSVALSAVAIAITMSVLHAYIVLASPTGPGIAVFKPFIAQSPVILGLDGLLAIAPVAGLAYLGLRAHQACRVARTG